MPLRISLAAAALALAACGARSSLALDEGGDAGEDSTTSASADAASTATGQGGAGQGGSGQGGSGAGAGAGGASPEGCRELAWAGEPTFVRSTSTPSARSPHLVALDAETVALVFEEVGGGSTLVSVAVDAWSAWPPVVTRVQPHFPVGFGGSPVAIAPRARLGSTPAGPPVFVFAAADGDGAVALGTAEPAQNGSTFLALTGLQGRARWLTDPAPGLGSLHLLAHGPENGLQIDLVDPTSPVATPLGMLGCTEGPLASDATAWLDGHLVGSANGDPFDDCLDPDAPRPPRFVQTTVVAPDGALAPGSALETSGIVDDVVVAARDVGGAWLAWQTDADDWAQIVPVASDGTFGDVGLSFGLFPGHGIELLGWRDGLAVATAGDLPDADTGLVLVQLFDGDFGYVAHTVSSPLTPLAPRGRPALISSTDGQSFLVAFEHHDTDGAVHIGVLRADCAP